MYAIAGYNLYDDAIYQKDESSPPYSILKEGEQLLF